MNRGPGSLADYASDVLGALASGLAADTIETGRKTLEVVRARSPELVLLSEETGEDLVATSAGFIDILLASLRSDLDLPWVEYMTLLDSLSASGVIQRGYAKASIKKGYAALRPPWIKK